MKIDANGALGEAGACGDFRSGHAFDQTENQGFAISLRQPANGVESGVGFVVFAGARQAGRGLVRDFVKSLRVAMKIVGAIARDCEQPTRKGGGLTKRGQVAERQQKNILDEIIGVGRCDARKQDTVNHARVALVKLAEGRAVALAGGDDELGDFYGFRHGSAYATGSFPEQQSCVKSRWKHLALNTKKDGGRRGALTRP